MFIVTLQPIMAMDQMLKEGFDNKLKQAAFTLDVNKTEKYLKKGANPNCNGKKRTPLLIAIIEAEYSSIADQENIVRKLLDYKADPNKTSTYYNPYGSDQSGSSALVIAASKNLTNICKILLENGAHVGYDGQYALSHAQKNKNLELENLLCNTYHIPKKKPNCCDQCSIQ
jgi:ankyrin repeat protein